MEFLSGVRVTDFSWVGAGAYSALLARFLGAEVIKIESRQRLDVTRYIQPKRDKFDVNASAMFNELALGKRSVTLNLSKSEGIELVKKIISVSDVVIENFRPGVMGKLGLDYASIVKFKPDIIMLSYSLSGQTGPEVNYLGYAPVAGALSGLGHLTGYSDGPPSLAGGDFDLITGAAALIPVVAALHYRRKTGKGQYIDFSSREGGTAFIGEAVLDYEMNSRDQSRCTNRDDVIVPNNCYKCQGEDMWISIAINTDEEWEKFCRITDHPQWLEDARFCDAYNRQIHQEELDRIIELWTIKHTDYEIMEMLQKGGIAAMPSLNTEQLEADPHLKERGIIQKVVHPVVGNISVLGVPWKVSGTRPGVTPGPLLGEANQYIFHDMLGLSDEEIHKLENDKVIY